ncbi:S26 family signal peptidase [uncultured Intestinimonas sp.]
MGDNRNNSTDSRSPELGVVDQRCVLGKALFILLPFQDAGAIESISRPR